jgi:hypothetical protein
MQENNDKPIGTLINPEPSTELPSNLIPYIGSADTTNAILNEKPVLENTLPEEEKKELTEEEKKELYINQLKETRVRFHQIKHKGNLTTNQFDISYKKERKRKNKIQRQSRKANR